MSSAVQSVAFVTDIHVCDARLAEHRDGLDRLATAIRAVSPDLVLLGGDLAGTTVPHRASPGERNALVGFLLALRQDTTAEVPVVVVRGNHDYPGDWDFLGALPGVTWVDRPRVVVDADHRYAVIGLPWLDKSAVDREQPYADAVKAAYEAAILDPETLRELLRMAEDRTSAVFGLGHIAVLSGILRPGQPVVPTADPVLTATWFHRLNRVGADAVMLGHYHGPQFIAGAGITVYYGGAVFAHEHGEELERGWTHWTRASSGDWVPAHKVLEQGCWMILRVDAASRQVTGLEPAATPLEGIHSPEDCAALRLGPRRCRVKVVISVGTVALEAARVVGETWRAALEAATAEVRLAFETATTTRAREGAAEIAAAIRVSDKLSRYLERVEPRPEAAVAERALQLLEEVEAGAL